MFRHHISLICNLAIRNWAAVNIRVRIAHMLISLCFNTFPGLGWLGHTGNSFSDFWEASIFSSILVTLLYMSTSSGFRYAFLPFPHRIYCYWLLCYGHSNCAEEKFDCGFICIYLMASDIDFFKICLLAVWFSSFQNC